MVTDRSVELRALCRRVVDALPFAEEALLTGSASRGEADELSDAEMLLVADVLPPVAEVAGLLRAEGMRIAEAGEQADGQALWLRAEAGRDCFELMGWTRARTEERVAGVLAGAMIDHGRIRAAEAFLHGLPLRTGGAIAAWQERLSVYPDGLAEKIVADATGEWSEPSLSVRAHLRPGGRVPLALVLVEDAENVLRIVFALNRVWEPGWKRLPRIVAPLERKPAALAERLETALSEPDATRALRGMRELVRDTLALAPDLPGVVRARQETASLLEDLA